MASYFESKYHLAKTDIKYIKGVGPKRAEALNAVGIRTALDLLYYFPRKYLDRSKIFRIKDAGSALSTQDEVTFIGRIKSVQIAGQRRKFLLVKLSDDTGVLKCVWFNGVQYFVNAFEKGELIAFSGRVTLFDGDPCLIHPEYDFLEGDHDEEFLHTGGIIPVYSSTDSLKKVGLDSRGFRRIIRQLVDSLETHFFPGDVLPKDVIRSNSLMNLKDALISIHHPTSQKHLEEAIRRFKFEELFCLELLFAIRRNLIKHTPGVKMEANGALVRKLVDEMLPFKLTESQKRSLQEIVADMTSEHPMQRLLQGEVGSGKTIVALIATVMAVESGCQVAFMTPTEILAVQHFETAKRYLDRLGIKTAILIGGQKRIDRAHIYAEIAEGKMSVVVGTHALIQEGVEFKKLGLIIVDEQHRFGVVQRMALQHKGENPHLLVMTATPIPRTLALTVYGDLDVSTISELPRGRKPVKTALRSESSREKVYRFIREQILAGRQAYIVYPLVNESEKTDLKAATQGFIKLRDEVFREFKVGLIHGQMTETEKNDVMMAFGRNEVNILVATTVIEVGIDNPNATVMLIEHADRFGLSQLHQLRGRIGRGVHQSYCILMTEDRYLNQNPMESREDAAVRKRLNVFVSTTDGFKIAEHDLALRGPGEFFGEKQSGLPPLKMASLQRDRDIIIQARISAFKIAEQDPHLRRTDHLELRDMLLKNYKESFEFLSAS
jgi:ATP-dependent DNA helicase RecG